MCVPPLWLLKKSIHEKIKFFFLYSSKYLSVWIYIKTTSFVIVKKSKKKKIGREKKKLT